MVKVMMAMVVLFFFLALVAKAKTPPALYIFGDSLLDSGNNNLLPTIAKANFSPYGIDFSQGPTGRFTNGRTVADFLAEYLGLPYSPPYLSLLRRIMRRDASGINFASGSCGILPETGSTLGKCLSLAEQVSFFKRVVERDLPRRFKLRADLSNHLSKSLFVVSVGSNDYINNYLDKTLDTSKNYSPQQFAQLLVNNLSLQFQRLYELGARKVLAFEIGPIGCIPSTTKQFDHDGQCAENINHLAVIFNNELAPMLQNLTSSLEGSSFILGHAHWLGYDAIINPSKYGISDSSNACCVTWFNGSSACIPGLRELACKERSRNYFWDGYHLTETVYKTIASLCFNGSSVCIPKNIKDALQI